MKKLISMTFLLLIGLQSSVLAADLISPEVWPAVMRSSNPDCKKLANLKTNNSYDPSDAKQRKLATSCVLAIASEE